MTPTENIVDHQERRRALKHDESFIVQAPAGSGKTELLTQRYLTLLACVNEPEEVIAVTFTNKAAGEMRGRILSDLHLGASEAPPSPHERVAWELARRVHERDRAKNWQLEAHPARLRIQTIDSLCAALTRQMPLLAHFGSQPGVIEDAAELYREAARSTLAELESGLGWSASVERLLQHLDNDLRLAEDLLAAMLARRDQWLRHVADRDNPRLERRTLEAGLSHAVREFLMDLRPRFSVEYAAEVVELARYAGKNLKANGSESDILACLGMEELPEAEPEQLSAWRGVAALLLTDSGAWRKACDRKIGFPPESKAKGSAQQSYFEHMKTRYRALVQSLREDSVLAAQLHALRRLPPTRFEDPQWEVMEALFHLLFLAAGQLWLVFRDRGQVDFVEVAQRALHSLEYGDAPTDLALALDHRIRHILVDEFQDTSLSQYALLEKLTAGWEAGDGRTLFVVGDPMQSIYRFREAEVGLYLKARRRGLGAIPLTPLQLKVNFRSQKGIVDWVNRAFPQVFPDTEDIASGAVRYAGAMPVHPSLDGPAVRIHAIVGDHPPAEAERVVELVREAQCRDPEGTVAILVRARTHLKEITPRLKAEGWRFRAVEIEPLGSRAVVQDLMALTRALAHPADRTAWLALLRAPWCGLALSDLHALVANDHASAVWDLMGDAPRVSTLSPDGRWRLGRVRRVLSRSLEQRRRYTLRRWVEGAWLSLGGPGCLEQHSDLQDAEAYLELLERLDGGGDLLDFEVLAQRVEGLFAAPDAKAGERLQIMTIHKAKGLAFDTVILPGLDRSTVKPTRQLLLSLERPRARDESDLLLAPIRERGAEQDPVYGYLEDLMEQKDRYEAGRLLYVAATRARKWLHLLGRAQFKVQEGRAVLQPPSGNSLLGHLWSAVADDFRHSVEASAGPAAAVASEERRPTLQKIHRITSDWTPPVPPPPVVWAQPEWSTQEGPAQSPLEFVWAGETVRHVGTVVHQVLQSIGRRGLSAWDVGQQAAVWPRCRASLAGLGVSQEDMDEALRRVRTAIELTLSDPRGRWILDDGHHDARVEYPLTGVYQDACVNVRIDRTFVDAQDVRWIIDYKTSVHQGGNAEGFLDNEVERYREQLERYAALMVKLERRPVRLGLYFPLMTGWRSWTPQLAVQSKAMDTSVSED